VIHRDPWRSGNAAVPTSPRGLPLGDPQPLLEHRSRTPLVSGHVLWRHALACRLRPLGVGFHPGARPRLVRFVWDEHAWSDCAHWQEQDRRVLKRVNALLNDIARAGATGKPNIGIGKPEALKHGFHGYWSRRITHEHRLVYKVTGDEIRIAACRYHYE